MAPYPFSSLSEQSLLTLNLTWVAKCLRGYRNQYAHDILQRGAVVDFLGQLLTEVSMGSYDDMLYTYTDKASALKALIETSTEVFVISDEITQTGPGETGPGMCYYRGAHREYKADSKSR
jgi:hypothetical protein